MEYVVRSHIGRVRSVNEDRAAVIVSESKDIAIAVVADGMGGHRGGDVASTMAVELLEERVKALTTLPQTSLEWLTWLQRVIEYLNEKIYLKALKEKSYKGMGTTLDIVILTENNIYVGHVGDSRVYLLDHTTIQLVTKDHSFVNALVDSGAITKEEAIDHPKKNWIVQALGSEKEVKADVFAQPLTNVSYVLLCTDGLTNKVADDEIFSVMNETSSLEHRIDRLIHLANERGGEDNISIIAFARRKEVGPS